MGYESEKRKALGFPADDADLFSVKPRTGSGFSVSAVFGNPQMLPPELLMMQSENLLLQAKEDLQAYAEYKDDQKLSDELLGKLISCLEQNDVERLRLLLKQFPAADWLSRIYIENDAIERLEGVIAQSGREVKTALSSVLEGELVRLETFKALLKRLKEVSA